MYRNLLGIGAVFAVALILVGITFSASQEAPADFRFINGTEPKTLDPHIMTGQPEGRIGDAIFEGLTFRDPETLKPQPGVAERWEISPDKKTYTFHLRTDARWSDGKPVTAHDFTWSWRRLQDPELGSEYAYILHSIVGAEVYNTYANQVKRLREEALPALAAARKAHPDGLAASAWQKLSSEYGLNDALKGTPSGLLQEALAQKRGTLDVARLVAMEQAIEAEADRRAQAHAHALEHFCVDEGVIAKDDHTLIVQLRAPTPYFLELTAFYSAHPVPRHVIEVPGNADDWFLPGKIVSNGPFRLAAWRVNEKIRLVRSETYWNKDAIRLGIIDAFPITNANTSLNLYLTGAIDWNANPPPVALVDVLKRERPDEFRRNAGMVVYYYRFNCTKKPFDDPRVRKAFCLAIDRQEICDHILRLGQPPAMGLVPPGMPDYEPPTSGIVENADEARSLLAEAGYPGGKGLSEIGLLYNTSESHEKIAEVISGQLGRTLGVTVKPFNQEWQAYQASTLSGEYDMARAGWIGDYADPNTFLDMWVTNGGNNQTGWSNGLYDRLIAFGADVDLFLADVEAWLPRFKEQDRVRGMIRDIAAAQGAGAQAEAKARLRLQLFREAEAILFQDEFPVMPIYFYVVSGLVRPEVKGWYQNLQDIHPLRGIWMEKRSGSGADEEGR